MLIYGHRGSPATFPENTLSSFQAAIGAGVDGLEFDIRASADGVPIVIHDRDLARTTSGHGNVDELSFSEIQKVDAGNGERVPTFQEVLTLAGDSVILDIEVKQPEIESLVLNTLAQFPSARWVLSSFDEEILIEFRRLSPGAALVPIVPYVTPELIPFARMLDAPAIALMASSYTESAAQTFANEHLPIIVWTVNDTSEAIRVANLGAYGLCTDCPAKLISAMPQIVSEISRPNTHS